jgi:phycoerythrobilin:ferredoxin oxidoreductase
LFQYEKEQIGDKETEESNDQEAYIQYRLNNDPAKPMLKGLYGEEFTDRVLQEVLFPELKQRS